MKLVDSHAHIYLEQFNNDIDATIERAMEAGVERIYMPNIDHTSIDDMLLLADRYPDYCMPMMGLHPCSVGKDFEKELYNVEEWLNKGDFVAVGEIGTDLYWDKTFWREQQEALRVQLEFASKFNLPFVIHCRESIDETIDLIKRSNILNLTGVFHCFTGTLAQAEEIIALGFKLGIGGVATFKNGGIGEVIEKISLDHLVLETDSPYLAPVPYRGKRNEPAYIYKVAEKVAEIKNISPDTVAEETTASAHKLFNYHVR
jgi:TatD DNase family protein